MLGTNYVHIHKNEKQFFVCVCVLNMVSLAVSSPLEKPPLPHTKQHQVQKGLLLYFASELVSEQLRLV